MHAHSCLTEQAARSATRTSALFPLLANGQAIALTDFDDVFKDADIVFSYTDSQAVDDGILIQFLTLQGRDTRHRITSNGSGRIGRILRSAVESSSDHSYREAV